MSSRTRKAIKAIVESFPPEFVNDLRIVKDGKEMNLEEVLNAKFGHLYFVKSLKTVRFEAKKIIWEKIGKFEDLNDWKKENLIFWFEDFFCTRKTLIKNIFINLFKFVFYTLVIPIIVQLICSKLKI
ncbi:hypothetical protein [Candidatus Mycoplasma haematohominis]|uniref:hypothetical protein n=1 Tax=Candidatus Mycoplasma haematohominis TaxID=1494318 RepID=UPI001C0A6F25|nr:hypothetical protein [Candidatus Mycoplasma haemohominis]